MPKMMRVTGTVSATEAEEKKLRAAGFAPVLRWIRPFGRSEKVFKTHEALAVVRREKRSDQPRPRHAKSPVV
jgi:hypothetical protein